jgi:hypothetical protein
MRGHAGGWHCGVLPLINELGNFMQPIENEYSQFPVPKKIKWYDVACSQPLICEISDRFQC